MLFGPGRYPRLVSAGHAVPVARRADQIHLSHRMHTDVFSNCDAANKAVTLLEVRRGGGWVLPGPRGRRGRAPGRTCKSEKMWRTNDAPQRKCAPATGTAHFRGEIGQTSGWRAGRPNRSAANRPPNGRRWSRAVVMAWRRSPGCRPCRSATVPLLTSTETSSPISGMSSRSLHDAVLIAASLFSTCFSSDAGTIVSWLSTVFTPETARASASAARVLPPSARCRTASPSRPWYRR